MPDLCEGLYRSDVGAGTGLALISLTRGEIPTLTEADSVLAVHVRGFAAASAAVANVRGVGRAPRTYYRLDARVRAGSQLTWRLGEVLREERLLPSDVGLFAWFGQGSDSVYVPVHVMRPGEPPPVDAPIRLWVRANDPIGSVSWRTTPVGGVASTWRVVDLTAYDDRIPPGQPFRVDLSELIDQNEVLLSVAGRVSGTDEWKYLTVRLRTGG